MSNSNEMDAALALWRFGLGAKEGGVTALGSGARDLLAQEIRDQAMPVPQGQNLQSTGLLLNGFFAYQAEVKAEREQQKTAAMSMAGEGGAGIAPAMAPMMRPDPAEKRPYFPQQILLEEVGARFSGTIHEPLIGFGERLAMFWTNHFSVAVTKSGEVHVLAGAFEREVIRPHVFGRFSDMLLAVETHPAMLLFLDNQQSIGPNSPQGKKKGRGLNENLAREIMELHTLGVDGGYTQGDVTSLASMITGWSFNRSRDDPQNTGAFQFNASAHEPGSKVLLGKTYPDGGFGQGRTALMALAAHPATAHHLAFKLARYFVADQPPPQLVKSMADAYLKNDGNLSAVYRAMIESDLAWQPQLTKLRQPLDYLTALLRTADLRPKPEQVLSALKALGQPFWNPSGPNGFADVSDAWASSEGLATRMDVASLFAHQILGNVDPRQFVADRLGPLASAQTLQAVARAETKPQGLAIAFLSPEFQRR
ncbi:DUF1800 domain-containing protein [Allorhizobium undicola]|uniref:DUF1800 domain-containing protein n=1 Tax=Allorhizobium undicola TaxID=78527 RepID=UPI003D33BBF6